MGKTKAIGTSVRLAGISLTVAAAAAFGMNACSHGKPQPARRTAADFVIAPPLEMGETWTVDNKSQVDQIVAINQKMLLQRTGSDSLVRRDAHPKHHGCVQAQFTIDSSKLLAEQRVGVFAPDARVENPAWIRFSNGDPDGANASDSKSDFRGMAIKLMNVTDSKSGSQDFVMLTSKEFFSRDGEDYIALHNALNDGKFSVGLYMIEHHEEAGILLGGQVKSPNPLQTEYFSAVPYKLGTRTMKFKARPCADTPVHDSVPSIFDDAPTNYLRERLVSFLAAPAADNPDKKAACFDFFVEPNMDMDDQPVEDPMKPWNETTSPYIPVAKITIPFQTGIDSAEQLNMCENLSFDPWHSLPATRPMGQINRMRAEIYPKISALRHSANHTAILEPTSFAVCTGETAALCATPKR